MLDITHIPVSAAAIQFFTGNADTTLVRWQTWTKPRGVKMVYMIGVGGGSSGGCGLNTATTSGGGAGGGSGAQTCLLIPAIFLPDQLYIQTGQGGRQPVTLVSAAIGVAGKPTYVAYEPFTTLNANTTLLIAREGQATGAAATTTTGGVGGTAAVVGSMATMPRGGRGIYNFLQGQSGTAGGTSVPAAGGNLTYPVTGLFVSAGSGGGGSGTTGSNSGTFLIGTQVLGGDIYPMTGATPSTTMVTASAAASGATPAGNGKDGVILKYNTGFLGGVGGGGATTTGGGNAGAGGNGAPGCGGGGAGGSNTTNTTLARPGDGGDGFVYIISW